MYHEYLSQILDDIKIASCYPYSGLGSLSYDKIRCGRWCEEQWTALFSLSPERLDYLAKTAPAQILGEFNQMNAKDFGLTPDKFQPYIFSRLSQSLKSPYLSTRLFIRVRDFYANTINFLPVAERSGARANCDDMLSVLGKNIRLTLTKMVEAGDTAASEIDRKRAYLASAGFELSAKLELKADLQTLIWARYYGSSNLVYNHNGRKANAFEPFYADAWNAKASDNLNAALIQTLNYFAPKTAASAPDAEIGLAVNSPR